MSNSRSKEGIQNLVARISTKINNLLIKKGVLEKVDHVVLVGNTEDIFSDSSQNSFEDIHLPAQAASVAHRIAFGPNAGQRCERLEKLVRYMARPAISDERVISEGPQSIHVKLKSRWSDGRNHFFLHPVNF